MPDRAQPPLVAAQHARGRAAARHRPDRHGGRARQVAQAELQQVQIGAAEALGVRRRDRSRAASRTVAMLSRAAGRPLSRRSCSCPTGSSDGSPFTARESRRQRARFRPS